jgi:hypothetical protein
MKPHGILLPIAALLITVFFIQAKKPSKIENNYLLADTVIEFTPEVRVVIDQKCFGCHNPNAKNEKAKGKLQWDSIAYLSKAKQIATMDDIIEVLEKGSMPPEKYLSFKPEAKLTEEEVKLLTEWANANADRLLK